SACCRLASGHSRTQLPPPTQAYTRSLHDALPISISIPNRSNSWFSLTLTVKKVRGRTLICPIRSPRNALTTLAVRKKRISPSERSEEHTSELQSRFDLVCRLLLEKKKRHSRSGPS